MAKRGRPPKAAPEAVPDAATRPPEMPETIAVDPVAAACWGRLTALLGPKATALDEGVLTAYCSTYAILVYARRELAPEAPRLVDDDGRPLKGAALAKALAEAAQRSWILTTSTDKGGTKQHPLVSLCTNASRDLARYADALGLTPLSRSRAGQVAPEKADELDGFLAETL